MKDYESRINKENVSEYAEKNNATFICMVDGGMYGQRVGYWMDSELNLFKCGGYDSLNGYLNVYFSNSEPTEWKHTPYDGPSSYFQCKYFSFVKSINDEKAYLKRKAKELKETDPTEDEWMYKRMVDHIAARTKSYNDMVKELKELRGYIR